MRIEVANGRKLMCGVMLHHSKIEVGQQWAMANGQDHVVTVTERHADWVIYTPSDGKKQTKDSFSFQCRYCLVVNEVIDAKQLVAA